MIILRIVVIDAVPDRRHEKVSIHTFVMVKRYQAEVIEPENTAHDKYRGGAASPY